MVRRKAKASGPKRNYSDKTLKVLFALSGNQCAHPDCKNSVILQRTEHSSVQVLAQISHIFAVSEDGPRGMAGLDESQLNSPDNLILFCPTHHTIIDSQHETYPATLLRQWKESHELKMQKLLSADLDQIPSDLFAYPYFPTVLVDQKIEEHLTTLRKSRFFVDFDRVGASITLAEKVTGGELSGGTALMRSRALAWCARILSVSQQLAMAEQYLKTAQTLEANAETAIAEAFIFSQRGDKVKALHLLATIDSPPAKSAALMINEHHIGNEGALNWLAAAGIEAEDLDADGKYFLLLYQFQLNRLDAAIKTLIVITDQDLVDAPVLHHMIAISHLGRAVPSELRIHILNQVPFEARSFPLASDTDGIKNLRLARHHFIDAAKTAVDLGIPYAAIKEDEYHLWLELRDPEDFQQGKLNLEARLRDPKSPLRLVRLGLQFGIAIDLKSIERKIEEQLVYHGKVTEDVASARFALAFTQKTPEDVANYVARHWNELVEFFDKMSLKVLEIEMLAQAGLVSKANDSLDELIQDGISVADQIRLRQLIVEAQGLDPLEAQKEQFKSSQSLSDLGYLVDQLEIRADWEGVCEYGAILFERTRALRDAERLANALSKTGKADEVLKFIRTHHEFVTQSKNLHLLYCWCLYEDGSLREARSEFASLEAMRDHPNYRALEVSLGITSGDWASLLSVVAHELANANGRTAKELIAAAQLAINLNSPDAKALILAAVSKGSQEADVLATAYLLASKSGWEDSREVAQWLERAANISGDDGPIKKMSLQDILDRQPEWNRRESETLQMLNNGEIPMFLAARSLNKSLIDLIIFPALTGSGEKDPRRRGGVPAYSGKRKPNELSEEQSIGLDATALLTLSFLNLLDKAFDSFQSIYLPHSTLAWLYEEKQNISFHQPSRIRDSHRILDLLATGGLERLVPSSIVNSDLASEIGDELAMLIAEAEAKPKDGGQRLVIRSSPVPKVATLLSEEADLSAHSAVMASCQSLVDKLQSRNLLTDEEVENASNYLQIHERPWPEQPEIKDGAMLYLDDLAISNLLHLQLLEKLKKLGFTVMVSPRKVDELSQLILHEKYLGKVNDLIERIRKAVKEGIDSGKILIARQNSSPEDADRRSLWGHPTVDVISLAGKCQAIIADDRFLNKHDMISNGGAESRLYSTLDLIDALAARGVIWATERWECRTQLRRAGYFFIPLEENELISHLNTSTISNEQLVESIELKAVRENILRVRMSTWLQLPEEALWLDRLIKTLISVIKRVWSTSGDLASALAQSNWILDHLELRGWAHRFDDEGSENFITSGRGPYILLLLTPPQDLSKALSSEYSTWIESKVLGTLKLEYPQLYDQIVDWYRKQIAEVTQLDPTKGNRQNDE